MQLAPRGEPSYETCLSSDLLLAASRGFRPVSGCLAIAVQAVESSPVIDPRDLLQEAMKLPPEAGAALAESLLKSLGADVDTDAAAAWGAAIERRIREIDPPGVLLQVSLAERRACDCRALPAPARRRPEPQRAATPTTPRPQRSPHRLASLAVVAAAACGTLEAQILTADAGVRSPELPSVRTLFAYRHYDDVDDLRLRAEAVYSPSRFLELESVLPLISRRIDIGAGSEELHGIGDASVRAKLALVRADDVMRSDRVALQGRAILPTGDADATVNGQPLHPRLQLGLGSFGFGLGAASTVVRDRHRASIAFEWQHRGDHDGFDPGDQLGLDLAYWCRLSPARFDPRIPEPEWRAVVEVRSLYAFRDRGPSGELSDRGVEIDGVVGLQLNAGMSLRGEIGLIVPLVDDLRTPFGDAGIGVLFGLTFYF